MTEQIEIREMVFEDLSFLNSVRNENCEYLHDKSTYTLKDNVKWFKTLKHPYFIVLMYGERVGYFRTSHWLKDSMYIGLDISSVYQGKGYATILWDKMIQKLRSMYNVNILYLEVLATNTRALHIYKKLGFKEIEEFPYSSEEVSIKMKLDISEKEH